MSNKLQFVEVSQQRYSDQESQQTEVCWTTRLVLLRPLDAEFFHPAAQRVGMQIKQLGRAFCAFDDPVGLVQNGDDVLPRYVLEARRFRLNN